MTQVVIENPILNGPFEEPRRHYQFDEDGITDQIEDKRRPSSYWVRNRPRSPGGSPHHPRGQRAARIRRGHESRVQEAIRDPD